MKWIKNKIKAFLVKYLIHPIEDKNELLIQHIDFKLTSEVAKIKDLAKANYYSLEKISEDVNTIKNEVIK